MFSRKLKKAEMQEYYEKELETLRNQVKTAYARENDAHSKYRVLQEELDYEREQRSTQEKEYIIMELAALVEEVIPVPCMTQEQFDLISEAYRISGAPLGRMPSDPTNIAQMPTSTLAVKASA